MRDTVGTGPVPAPAGFPRGGDARSGGAVLTITPAAAQVIDRLTSETDAVGLRVTRTDLGALFLDLADGPEDDDTVVTTLTSDVVVFVDPVAVPRLEDAVLDAKSEPGAAAFFLR